MFSLYPVFLHVDVVLKQLSFFVDLKIWIITSKMLKCYRFWEWIAVHKHSQARTWSALFNRTIHSLPYKTTKKNTTRGKEMNKSNKSITDKGFTLMDNFRENLNSYIGNMTLSELSERAGIPFSTLRGMLYEIVLTVTCRML